MYISTCLAYNEIKVIVDTLGEHVNFQIEDERSSNAFSFTLSGFQTATLATALLEILMKIGERPDPLAIFGKAKLVQKEAA